MELNLSIFSGEDHIGGAFPDLKEGKDFIVDGLPTMLTGAQMLADQDKKAFEIWAVHDRRYQMKRKARTKASMATSHLGAMSRRGNMRSCR